MQSKQEVLEFLRTLQKEINELKYGTLTIAVDLRNGLPNLQTLSITKMSRKRYGK